MVERIIVGVLVAVLSGAIISLYQRVERLENNQIESAAWRGQIGERTDQMTKTMDRIERIVDTNTK